MEVLSEFFVEKVKFIMSKRISKEMISSMHIGALENLLANEFVFFLESKILGQRDRQSYEVGFDIPKNWWEHFKQDNLPQWYVNRYPVKTKRVTRTITFTHCKLFPDREVPKEGRVAFHSYTKDADVYLTSDDQNGQE